MDGETSGGGRGGSVEYGDTCGGGGGGGSIEYGDTCGGEVGGGGGGGLDVDVGPKTCGKET
jgi:hypothetical protein